MAIDRDKIINEMSKTRLQANEEGLIPALGVYVQELPVAFWNRFAARMIKEMPPDLQGIVEDLLEQASHECGYHTGHGIITSDQFKEVVGPMIEKEPEDTLHGAYAVFAAWGWADAEIVDLKPGEEITVRAHNYYEADGAKEAGITKPFAYMIKGVTAGFMDLAYGDPYPNGMNAFTCMQTKGIEMGDEYGEFTAFRK